MHAKSKTSNTSNSNKNKSGQIPVKIIFYIIINLNI